MHMRREQQLRNRATRTARMPMGELRRHLVSKAVPTFSPEIILVMTLKPTCCNGHLLMGRGLLGLMRDWMDCGLIRGCLI